MKALARREKIFPENMSEQTSSQALMSLPSIRSTGRILLFDPRTCWAIIAPSDGSQVLPGKITFSVPHHLHLHDAVTLIVGKEYDETEYEYDMNYDLSKEFDVDTYKSLVLWDSVNNIAVLSNGSGRLKITTYSNSRDVVPAQLHLPLNCKLFLREL